MAIRFGMTIADMIRQLTRGFRAVAGREPDGLEKIKIQQEAVQRFKDMNKVVDMEGKAIDTSKGIMGGKQIQDSPEFGKKIRETYDAAKGPGKGQEMVDALKSPGAKKSYKIMEDQLGVKLYGDETFDEILEIQRTGKHPRETKRIMDDIKEIEDPEDMADGGRIGYKLGSIDKARRAFLKTMGAAGAGIGALKTGILGLGEKAAPMVEAVKETVTQAPNYFFELAEKIRRLGRMSDGPSERIKEYSLKGSDGNSELMLIEDIGTGEMQVKKIGKEGDDMVTEVQTMEYTPGSSLADETTQGIPADQYEEFTEYNSRIYKDEYNDPMIEEGINVEDIVKEVKDQAPPIKKAGGGIAVMLGE